MAALPLYRALTRPSLHLPRHTPRWYSSSSSSSSTVVTIGGVRKVVGEPERPELVPTNYLPPTIPKVHLHLHLHLHLRRR